MNDIEIIYETKNGKSSDHPIAFRNETELSSKDWLLTTVVKKIQKTIVKKMIVSFFTNF